MAINKSVRFKDGALTTSCASDSGIDMYLRIKLDSSTGKAVLAGNDVTGAGVAISKADSFGNFSFWTYNEAAALCHVAAGAVTKYAPVYAAASGKVASSGSVLIGFALEAATAAGDVIPVLSLASGTTIDPEVPEAAAVAALTDSSGGTASDTIAAAASTDYTKAEIANSFASLAKKINDVISSLKTAGLMASE